MKSVFTLALASSLLCAAAQAQSSSGGVQMAAGDPLRTPRHAERRIGHAALGPAGIKSTTWTEKPKSKQDIEDEKKLNRDMHICDGC